MRLLSAQESYERECRYKNESNCEFVFVYGENPDSGLRSVRVQELAVCPPPAPLLAIGLGKPQATTLRACFRTKPNIFFFRFWRTVGCSYTGWTCSYSSIPASHLPVRQKRVRQVFGKLEKLATQCGKVVNLQHQRCQYKFIVSHSFVRSTSGKKTTQETNPLYKEVTTTFRNPAYGLKKDS